MSIKPIFGGIVTITLLFLYVFAVGYAIIITNCIAQTGCTSYTRENFTSGMVLTLTTIGALVSALVITELAITRPGEVPGARTLAEGQNTQPSNVFKLIATVYLAVCGITGLAAFIVGVLYHPGILQSLTDLGQAWLGLAASASYAYLGVNPQE